MQWWVTYLFFVIVICYFTVNLAYVIAPENKFKTILAVVVGVLIGSFLVVIIEGLFENVYCLFPVI